MRGWGPAACDRLHRTADLELELYGEVVSPSVREHVDGCLEPLLEPR